MEERLEHILENVNGWLKFAEGKNAVLLATNGAFAFGLLKINFCQNNKIIMIAISISIVLFAISSFICLLSFLPVTSVCEAFFLSIVDRNQHITENNLCFYGDIRLENPNSYLKKLYLATKENYDDNNPFQLYLATQVIANSSITWRKLVYFKIALCGDILAFCMLFIGSLCNFVL